MSTVLILGSNSDVGQATAYRFANEGFAIILASRNLDDYQKRLASDISIRHNVATHLTFFDALKTDEHFQLYQSLPEKPTVVISVFGYLGNHEKAINDFSESSLIFNSNFMGNVSILSIIANEMEKLKRGTIICLSSVAGDRGRKSNYFYGSAKAALTAFLSGLRGRLLASNVQVITIIPGFIKTKMVDGLTTPKPVTATPEKVADTIWMAYTKKKNVVYVLPIWRLIMFVIKNIPEFIFKKMNL